MNLLKLLAAISPVLLLGACGGIDVVVYSSPGAQSTFVVGDY